MPRKRLPNRRPNITLQAHHLEPGVGQHRFLLTFGYDPEGNVQEVFASGHREGSTMAHIMADACIQISVMLQHGITLDEIGHSLGTVPLGARPEDGETAASLVGTIVDYAKVYAREETAAAAVALAEEEASRRVA